MFYDAPPERLTVPIVTLAQGPVLVWWTGEPVWVKTHWVAEAGRKGRSMPCLGVENGCRIHTAPPRLHVCAPAVRPALRRARVVEREDPAAERHRQWRALSADARAALEAEAVRRQPELAAGRPGTAWLREQAAVALLGGPAPVQNSVLPPSGAPGPGAAAFEPVIVDMPDGCADELVRLYDGGPWRGRKCRLRRPSVLRAKTIIELHDEPLPADLPEPASVRAELCRLWGYALEQFAEDLDERDRSVLRFAARA